MVEIIEICFPIIAFVACSYLIYMDRKHFRKVENELNKIEKDIHHE